MHHSDYRLFCQISESFLAREPLEQPRALQHDDCFVEDVLDKCLWVSKTVLVDVKAQNST